MYAGLFSYGASRGVQALPFFFSSALLLLSAMTTSDVDPRGAHGPQGTTASRSAVLRAPNP